MLCLGSNYLWGWWWWWFHFLFYMRPGWAMLEVRRGNCKVGLYSLYVSKFNRYQGKQINFGIHFGWLSNIVGGFVMFSSTLRFTDSSEMLKSNRHLSDTCPWWILPCHFLHNTLMIHFFCTAFPGSGMVFSLALRKIELVSHMSDSKK